MFESVTVLSRIYERHPDINEEDVLSAVRNPRAVRRRNFDPPCHFAMAGPDTKGRMVEIVGVEDDRGGLIVYHAMKLTDKMAKELELMG